MKRIILFSAFAVLLIFLLPPLLSVPKSDRGAETDPVPELTAPPQVTAVPTLAEPEPVLDKEITLRVQTGDGVQEMSMAEYLPCALAGEMPASFAPEALKAQAVALRTYALFYQSQPKAAHPSADVCCSADCCAAFLTEAQLQARWGTEFAAYYEKICAAAEATDGQYLVWEESPALTVFHASSSGKTEAGAALGVSRPYLASVDTPETAETVVSLCTTVEVSPENFCASVLALNPAAQFSGGPETWLGAVSLDTAGRVQAMELGGVSLSGLALRQAFSLRSTAFTVQYTEGCFVFRVAGYGHGLGMSQYGADLMAEAGSDYREILLHYYPGTALVMALRREG